MIKKVINEVTCAFVIVSIFFITACPQINDIEQNNHDVPPVVTTPDNDPSVPISKGELTAFYIDNNNQPSTVDRGITGLTVVGSSSNDYPLIISEDTEDGLIVRFISLNRARFSFSVSISMYFGNNRDRLSFPDLITLEVDGGIENFKVNPYNSNTQTFEIIDEYGGVIPFTLNKNVLTAYQDDPSLTSSQNLRMKNMITAIAVASVIEIAQEQNYNANMTGYNGYSVVLTGGGYYGDYTENMLDYGGYRVLTGGGAAKTVGTVFKALAVVAVAAFVFLVR